LALAATIAGIVANALTFQHERNPMPFFPAGVQDLPQVAARAATNAVSNKVPIVSPPARPPDLPAVPQTSAVAGSRDPIGDMLRGGVNRDPRRLLGIAQAALIKLGYPIRNGGVVGADTLAALREFEKTRGMALSTEITLRAVKQLLAVANASASR
jgi:hypothetical protein